tara:strand:+ start:154 stop:405 length:252 start_codon:yes stop_codon:yes gene_type:complete
LAPIYDYAGHIGLMLIAAAPGDANFDGIVDVADLGILGANWSASKATGTASALVPEPTTMAVLGFGLVCLGCRCRKVMGTTRP